MPRKRGGDENKSMFVRAVDIKGLMSCFLLLAVAVDLANQQQGFLGNLSDEYSYYMPGVITANLLLSLGANVLTYSVKNGMGEASKVYFNQQEQQRINLLIVILFFDVFMAIPYMQAGYISFT